MSYLKDESGNVYYDAYESPSQAFTPEEWAVEKTRLISGLTEKIAGYQSQIDNTPQSIEIIESYPDDVKQLIQDCNDNLPISDVEYLEEQIAIAQALLAEIEGI